MPKSAADDLTKIHKKIIGWLKCPRAQRQYFGQTKAELLAETRKSNIKWGSNLVIVKLRELLATSDCAGLPSQLSNVSPSDLALLAILKASFTKPQVFTETGYTRRGHELEDHFIRQLWKQSEDGKPGKASFRALYRPGFVVSKKGDELHGAVKDSVDAADTYVEELDGSASEDSLSSGSEGGNEQNRSLCRSK
jgi:hypothetical protein